MNNIKMLFLAGIVLLASGCVSVQQPIPINKTILEKGTSTIGVIQTEAPEAETHYTGNIGLLDYAIIAGVNGSLDKHLKSLTFDEYPSVSQKIKDTLDKEGIKVRLIEESIALDKAKKLKAPKNGQSKNDFSQYAGDLDYLLLVQLHQIGTTRSYYGPAPTSEPVAQTVMSGQLIDLSSNNLMWYFQSSSQQVIQAPWDEKEAQFPNLTTAVYQSFDNAVKQLLIDLNGTSAASYSTSAD